ncbi:zinc finger protein ubi-d4 A isoform X2 [Bombyx mori]|uniref:Zinc finger protein ubi-d4 n=1 Tax=Bombyx mori TaxID=7091 RepID=A0A8R2C6U5_BOMMO|nr:zinc finger protein ubi-d4 A isoform X3 [Bombyx mori]XP_021204569.1 zinc finger protein ubi-d4 A isoform X3 [Bombyx mori]
MSGDVTESASASKMAAAEIQIVNPQNLTKIESFLHDPSYKEIIENSSTFNSRLCAERRMRMPFIDTQTGVAQSHCNLFMTRRQRMPGQKEGQVYTYPAQRWRKARRQYLTMSSTRWGWNRAADLADNTGDGENSSGLPDALGGDDSRDGSQTAAKDDPKEWFYDELAMEEMETGEEPEAESDEDYYDDTYANRRKRRGGATPTGPGSRGGRTRKSQPDDTPAKRGRAGRGRRRAGQGTLPYEVPGDAEKPYGCELCGAKYKTRAGLTYHFTHTHKDPPPGASTSAVAGGSDGDSRDSPHGTPAPNAQSAQAQPATEYQDSYVTFLNNPAAGAAAVATPPARRPTPPPRPASADTSSSDSAHAPLIPPAPAPVPAPAPPVVPVPVASASAVLPILKEPETKASPSPYCDFCLGDDRENRKTGTPEELVSCSDCGRSGHPTCLQFTVNMIVSVRKYRWQCIECKCCSVCGTSDNDDQLLFCDDCDRGYHMYCLAPPLDTPPEGSWSCALCIKEFHQPRVALQVQ